MHWKRVLIALLVTVSAASCKTVSDEAGVNHAWHEAIVEIPKEGTHAYDWQWYTQTSALPADGVEGIWPLVIYMHGCNGGTPGPLARDLVEAGIAVVTPNSLARPGYDGSCIPERYLWGLRRDAPAIRLADLGHAVDQAKQLPWVDPRNIFLVGQSEGGATVAKFDSSGQRSVRARVIGGDACDGGLNAPRGEPVLAILGQRDPVFESWGGVDRTCGRLMHSDNGSHNMFYRTGRASMMHAQLTRHPETRRMVVDFLLEHKVQ